MTQGQWERLKQRARRLRRRLQGVAKGIPEGAAAVPLDDVRKIAARWRQRLAGTMVTDSADLVREDRDR